MSLRVEQGFEHFREALARVLASRVEFVPGVLVTVLKANLTRDQRHAKVILSVMPESAEKTVLQILHDWEGEIKEGLAEELRMRQIPRLHWHFDENEAYASSIDETIKHLKEKGDL